MLTCRKCKKSGPYEEFIKDKYTKSGFKNLCKCCGNEINKIYRQKNPEKTKQNTYKWRESNTEYWLNYLKYRRETLDKPFQRKERKEKRTREEARAHAKQRKSLYDQRRLEEQALYREKNRERLRQNSRNFRSRKKESGDVEYKILCALRSRLGNALARYKRNKTENDDTRKLLGCSITFFINWLEKNFENGMTWDNYGYGPDKWHIDHNIPCISFDLTKQEERDRCFHWSNLFPMWGSMNLRKHDKILTIDYEI